MRNERPYTCIISAQCIHPAKHNFDFEKESLTKRPGQKPGLFIALILCNTEYVVTKNIKWFKLWSVDLHDNTCTHSTGLVVIGPLGKILNIPDDLKKPDNERKLSRLLEEAKRIYAKHISKQEAQRAAESRKEKGDDIP